MPIVQISKMQHRAGSMNDLPQLDVGELGFATDENRLFIGNDPLLHPAQGGEVTNTEVLTNDPNCSINGSQITGTISIDTGNLHISGGTNGYVLQTDGAGNVSWITIQGAGGIAAGANTQIQYNNGGHYDGSPNLTFNNTTNTLTVDNMIVTANLGVIGNFSAANVLGNGAGLTNLNGANLTGQVPNALIAGTVFSNAQPNITSVGTLASLNVSGNVTSTHFRGSGNLLANLQAGNISGQVANALIAGTVYTNAQPNITSVGVLANISSTGTANLGNLVTANFFSGSGNLLSNIQASNVTGVVSSATIAATVTTNAQPNITSVGSLANLTVTGNISALRISADGGFLANLPGGNINGTVSRAAAANTATTRALTDNSTNIATTAFVHSYLPTNSIIMWYGSPSYVPTGWLLCDGNNGTPDLRDRFIVGAGGSYPSNATGGSKDAILVSHTHTASSTSTVYDPGHVHGNSIVTTYPTIRYDGISGTPVQRLGDTSSAQTNITVGTTTAIDYAGVDGTNKNLPPYFALCFIMKA